MKTKSSENFNRAVLAMTAKKFVKPVKKFVKPEVVKFMEVSTCHITAEDNNKMSNGECGDLNFDSFAYGYYVWVPAKEDVDKLPISDGFKTLLHYARESGFRYIKLDCDAVAYPQLQKFDW